MSSRASKTEFNLNQLLEMFDPEQMKQAMAAFQAPGLDVQAMLASNKKNYEAMVAANKAATDVYQDFYRRQMSIFQELMKAAQSQIDTLKSAPSTEVTAKHADIYRAATEKAFDAMTALAEATRQANQDAFSVIEGRVKEAIEDLKKV